jgi:hypothetical protein
MFKSIWILGIWRGETFMTGVDYAKKSKPRSKKLSATSKTALNFWGRRINQQEREGDRWNMTHQS